VCEDGGAIPVLPGLPMRIILNDREFFCARLTGPPSAGRVPERSGVR